MTHPLHILADRVEGLEGPDQQIDLEISVRVNWKGAFGDPTVIYQWSAGSDEIVCWHPPKKGKPVKGYLDPAQFVPRWTGSLDSAASLVPEGHYWSVDNRALAIITPKAPPADSHWDCLGAATPALALTAASLRARAAMEQSNG